MEKNVKMLLAVSAAMVLSSCDTNRPMYSNDYAQAPRVVVTKGGASAGTVTPTTAYGTSMYDGNNNRMAGQGAPQMAQEEWYPVDQWGNGQLVPAPREAYSNPRVVNVVQPVYQPVYCPPVYQPMYCPPMPVYRGHCHGGGGISVRTKKWAVNVR